MLLRTTTQKIRTNLPKSKNIPQSHPENHCSEEEQPSNHDDDRFVAWRDYRICSFHCKVEWRLYIKAFSELKKVNRRVEEVYAK